MRNAVPVKGLVILNLIGVIIMITVNTLANALPINNMNTGELSDLYPNLFVPAGITFSIWGLIYFLLVCFALRALIGVFNNNDKVTMKVDQIGYWFFISCLANAAWIFAWHYMQIEISVAIMLVLLVSLIVIYTRLRKLPLLYTKSEYFFLQLPFGIYLGWITIATIANITALLVHLQWNRFGLSEDVWLTIMLIIAVGLTMYVIKLKKDFEYAAVVIWALAGIIIKRHQESQTGLIGYYAAIVGIVIICISLYIFLRPKNSL